MNDEALKEAERIVSNPHGYTEESVLVTKALQQSRKEVEELKRLSVYNPETQGVYDLPIEEK